MKKEMTIESKIKRLLNRQELDIDDRNKIYKGLMKIVDQYHWAKKYPTNYKPGDVIYINDIQSTPSMGNKYPEIVEFDDTVGTTTAKQPWWKRLWTQ